MHGTVHMDSTQYLYPWSTSVDFFWFFLKKTEQKQKTTHHYLSTGKPKKKSSLRKGEQSILPNESITLLFAKVIIIHSPLLNFTSSVVLTASFGSTHLDTRKQSNIIQNYFRHTSWDCTHLPTELQMLQHLFPNKVSWSI